MKKILLWLCCVNVFAGLNLQACQENSRPQIVPCLIVAGSIVLGLSLIYVSSEKVAIKNESNELLYLSWNSGLSNQEDLLGPNKVYNIYHITKIRDLCARNKKWTDNIKCATNKAAGYDEIKTWYINEDLSFTADFNHDKQPLDSDTNMSEFRSYQAEKQVEYFDMKKGNLRGY